MSDAVSGIGTIFNRWDTDYEDSSAGAWVALAEVNNISGPSMTRASISVTSLDSTDGYEEFIAGLRNGGTVVFSMNFTRANYELMKEDFESDDLVSYQIVLPDDELTSLEFTGLVMEMPLTIPIDDKITIDVTIQISSSVELDSWS